LISGEPSRSSAVAMFFSRSIAFFERETPAMPERSLPSRNLAEVQP
jgi:hypothetical protein